MGFIKQKVLWLQISMCNAQIVKVFYAIKQLLEVTVNLSGIGQNSTAKKTIKVAASHKLHDFAPLSLCFKFDNESQRKSTTCF